jgi:hypothetical protein
MQASRANTRARETDEDRSKSQRAAFSSPESRLLERLLGRLARWGLVRGVGRAMCGFPK